MDVCTALDEAKEIKKSIYSLAQKIYDNKERFVDCFVNPEWIDLKDCICLVFEMIAER